MKVKFRTTLGSRDADQIGLDHAKCQCGDELDVSSEAAEWLLSRGIAEAAPKAKAKAAPAKKEESK